jgi:hypothetical protein
VYVDPSTAMDVTISHAARAFIDERGGRLFVWGEDFGRYWMTLKASTSPPGGTADFEERLLAGVRLYLSPEATGIHKFKVGLRRFPRRSIVIRSGGLPPPSL